MTETITIDSLPEGYTVITTPHYHDLRYGLKNRLVASRSTRYKEDKTAKYFLNAAKVHAAQMQRDAHRAAEEAFCEGFSTEQLEGATMKDLHAILLDLRVGINRNIADYTFWIETTSLDNVLAKLESQTEAQS